MEKTHLGRALKSMVTLASKLGYNYDELFEAFDLLKNSLLGNKQREEELYSTQAGLHESSLALTGADLAKYQAEVS